MMNSMATKICLCFVFLAFLPMLQTIAGETGTPFWLKTWSVAEIDSSAADRASFSSTIGKHIAMEPNRLVNPLAEDCMEGLSYDDVRPRPIAELDEHFGAFWKWPPLSKPMTTYGWIRCKGSNVGAFAFVNAKLGYLFYEGGTIIVLR
jgi:hypothetical protein